MSDPIRNRIVDFNEKKISTDVNRNEYHRNWREKNKKKYRTYQATYSSLYRGGKNPIPVRDSYCLQCGTALFTTRSDKKYCSRLCASRYYRHKIAPEHEKVCVGCKKSFTTRRRDSKYCTRDCAIKKEPVRIECKTCKKVFYLRPSKSKGVKFCSHNCRKNKKKLNCDNCGNTFYRAAGAAASTGRKFCGRKCTGLYASRLLVGSRSNNFKNAGHKNCANCGKSFHSYDKKRTYCGLICAAQFKGTATNFHKRMGLEAEIRCARALRSQGYHTQRSAGSRGAFDIVGVSFIDVLLIQVKSMSRRRGLSPSVVKYFLEDIQSVPTPSTPIVRRELWCWLRDSKEWKIYLPSEDSRGYTKVKNVKFPSD